MKKSLWQRKILVDRKIVESLLEGKSNNAIALSLKVHKRRVREVRAKAIAAGYIDGSVSLPRFPETVFEGENAEPVTPTATAKLLSPYRERIEAQLKGGWHKVTVFEELPVKVPRSNFYRYLDAEKLGQIKTARVVPEIVHKPGEALILDWGKLTTIRDPSTGKRRHIWAFIGVLGYSRLMVVRVVERMDTSTTINALNEMLRELGGAPTRATSDNPKCFAQKADQYEAILNPIFERWAAYNGIRAELLPPADPEKKGKVERMVPFVRRLWESHDKEWYGVQEAQGFIDRKCAIANERIHGSTREKPLARFVSVEADALKPLPLLAYIPEEVGQPTVRKDGHICFKHKFYSVGEEHIGKEVFVLADHTHLRIYLSGKLLEIHERILDNVRMKSTKEHHLKSWEQNLQDGRVYLQKASKIGPHCRKLLAAILGNQGGFVDTRIVWGILSFEGEYSNEDINSACKTAFENHSYSYQFVRRILETNAKRLKKEPVLNRFARSGAEYAELVEEKTKGKVGT
jgi:hypothetical protein